MIPEQTNTKEAVSFAFVTLSRHMVGLTGLDACEDGNTEQEDSNMKTDDREDMEDNVWELLFYSRVIEDQGMAKVSFIKNKIWL